MKDIRTLRQKHNLRLSDLARLAQVSPSDLSKCERGLILPGEDFFVSIAGVFGVDSSSLKETQQAILNTATPGEGYTTAKMEQKSIIYRKKDVINSKISILDVFCGTGGFSHGFEQTNEFQVAIGIDLLKDRAETFSANHIAADVVVDDINNIDYVQLEGLGPKPEVIIGGPPCQGFSSIRPFRTLTENDPRNNLFESFSLLIDHFRPSWFVMENVVGFLTHKQGSTLKAILQLFEQIGYKVDWKVLNAALYGLPQRRERLIIVGNICNKKFYWPEPTHYFNGRSMAGKIHGQYTTNLPLFGIELHPAVTVMDAIHDLPEIKSGEFANDYRNDIELTKYEQTMRGENTKLTLHDSTKHSDHMLNIIRNSGYNRSALPEGMTSSGFSSSYSRLEPFLPSVTLTVNFVHPASNKCIHPYQDRALTPREGARLQGFEDSYTFKGSRAQIVKQIGNAVPPLLGRVIADTLLRHI